MFPLCSGTMQQSTAFPAESLSFFGQLAQAHLRSAQMQAPEPALTAHRTIQPSSAANLDLLAGMVQLLQQGLEVFQTPIVLEHFLQQVALGCRCVCKRCQQHCRCLHKSHSRTGPCSSRASALTTRCTHVSLSSCTSTQAAPAYTTATAHHSDRHSTYSLQLWYTRSSRTVGTAECGSKASITGDTATCCQPLDRARCSSAWQQSATYRCHVRH